MRLWSNLVKGKGPGRPEKPPFAIVHLHRKFTRAGDAGVSAEIKRLAAAGNQQTIIVDFSECEYIDSFGLGSLVGPHCEAMSRGQRLVAAAVPEKVRSLLGITKMDYLLASPLRKWLGQDPEKILRPYVHEGMTVLEPGPGMGFFTMPSCTTNISSRGTPTPISSRKSIFSRP